jgi:alpha-L-arabinofuranosidase
VFAGEYACHASGKKWNHYYASLLEAAFMTGLERNADIVHMATYAPLFAHVEGWQWRPDLIWYDNLNSFRTVSWHVQQLYSQYKGQNVLTLTMSGKPVAGQDGQNGLFASAVRDGNQIYIKVANTSEQPQNITLNFTGLKKKENVKGVKRICLNSDKLYEDNSIDAPNNITPVELPFDVEGKSLEAFIEPLSFCIYIISVDL